MFSKDKGQVTESFSNNNYGIIAFFYQITIICSLLPYQNLTNTCMKFLLSQTDVHRAPIYQLTTQLLEHKIQGTLDLIRSVATISLKNSFLCPLWHPSISQLFSRWHILVNVWPVHHVVSLEAVAPLRRDINA